MWKLPSPTWPTSVPVSGDSSRSRFDSTMQSARREMGTQASVRPRLGARPQRQRGVVGVVPRPPQPRAILGPRHPRESESRVLRASACTVSACSPTSRSVWPWNSKKSVGSVRIVELREPVDRVHLHFVEQLDPRDGNAQLNRRDHRPAPRRRSSESRRPPPQPPRAAAAAAA